MLDAPFQKEIGTMAAGRKQMFLLIKLCAKIMKAPDIERSKSLFL